MEMVLRRFRQLTAADGHFYQDVMQISSHPSFLYNLRLKTEPRWHHHAIQWTHGVTVPAGGDNWFCESEILCEVKVSFTPYKI